MNPNDPPRYFTGLGQAGNWADPNNWNGGGHAVQAGGDAVIAKSTIMNGSFSDNMLSFLDGSTVTVNGAISTTSATLCLSFMICDSATGIFTPGSSFNDAGGFIVGYNHQGTLLAEGNATSHATINAVSSKIGLQPGGQGLATIAGGVWNTSTNFYVGLGGNGTLNVNNGGMVNVGGVFVMGGLPGASGTATVSGGGQINVVGNVAIGGGLSGSGSGTMTVGTSGTLTAGGGVSVSAGSALIMAGGVVNAARAASGVVVSGNLSGQGTINAQAGGISDAGTITASGGTLVLNGALSGSGHLNIAGGSTAQITGAALGNVGIAFTGAGANLVLAHGAVEHGTISGFVAGDTIVMAGVDAIGWNGTTDILTLSSHGTAVDQLHLAGTYAGNPFTLTQSAAGAIIGVSSQQSGGITHH